MEPDRSYLPIHKEYLLRPRVQALLAEGARHPLTTIVAGPGYGKTQSVAAFARDVKARLIWLQIDRILNVPALFWRDLRLAVARELPALSQALLNFPFPQSPSELDAFLHLFSRQIYLGSRVVAVVDGYEALQDAAIRRFFEALIEADLEHFSLIIVSSRQRDFFLGMNTDENHAFRLSAAQFRFNRKETRALFAHNGLSPSRVTLDAVEKLTDGWPLAIRLVIRQLLQHPELRMDRDPIDMAHAMALLRREYFDIYEEPIQRLLIKLALLEEFTPSVLSALSPVDMHQVSDLLSQNLFITRQGTHPPRYIIQASYHLMLLQMKSWLSAEETDAVYAAAGPCFLADGEALRAANCFARCGKYDDLLRAIRQIPPSTLDHASITFLLDQLDTLPAAFIEARPEANLIRANLFFFDDDISRAEAMLLDLIRLLETQEERAEATRLIGEACFTLAELYIARSDPLCIHYMRRAYNCLPNGSDYRDANFFPVANDSVFFTPAGVPGGYAAMEDLVLEASVLARRLYRRQEVSIGFLAVAEGAMHTWAFDRAQEMAYRAIHSAQFDGQHDVLCNALFVLLRIAVLRGNAEQAAEHLDALTAYIQDNNLTALYNLRDSVLAWYYMKLRNLTRVPLWVQQGLDLAARLRDASDRDMLMCGAYYMELGNYHHALAVLDQTEIYCTARGMYFITRLSTRIMSAICYARSGREDEALRAFHQAYTLARPNGLLLIFAEMGRYMRSLVDLALARCPQDFDEAWLRGVRAKASTYAKHLSSMSKALCRAEPQTREEGLLSHRQREVLDYLVKGFTQAQISEAMHISINSVKKHILSIYNKLGAVNRAEAIYIATTQKLIN
ncbi:MAG: LuxR C-terminal-related transcriptional regulator [Oscillospiraceae bacterium]|jgi:LuxR family maltose regulon positive regulatory protein|nr:LuxR C-terminal-related transcriptional regulator [Oscillospiraceae bacterium]